MKHKILIYSAFILVTLSINYQTPAQIVVPKYTSLSADNPFSKYRVPVGVALLRFDGDPSLGDKLFDILKQDTSVLKRFIIFPYNVLKAQMDVLNLTSLDPNDQHTLDQLRDQLNISLILTGKIVDNGFELRLLSTNGVTAYSCVYQNTSKSTAINDAIKLFTSNIQTQYINVGDIKWALVDGGTFQMGSTGGYGDELPVHTVTVKSFYMSPTEVTFDQYDAFCDATGRAKPDDNGWGRGQMPVSDVSWDDANAYCSWLSEQLGETVRLPTEAEFEYAAERETKAKAINTAAAII